MDYTKRRIFRQNIPHMNGMKNSISQLKTTPDIVNDVKQKTLSRIKNVKEYLYEKMKHMVNNERIDVRYALVILCLVNFLCWLFL